MPRKNKGKGKGRKGKKGGKKGSEEKQEEKTAPAPESVQPEIPAFLRTDGQASKNIDIKVPDFTMSTPDGRPLIHSCEFRLINGRHYGFIGKNGIGKTTLLNMISGRQIPQIPDHLEIVHVKQESEVVDEKVIPFVLASDPLQKKIDDFENELLDNLDNDTAPENWQELLDLIEERRAGLNLHLAETRVREILTGLQFTEALMEKSLTDLSGGWRMRVALACALFQSPDILLLDEPTNHLDFPAVVWLQNYLKTFDKTLLLVSHDRHFIDEVITDVIEFANLKLNYYKGDYTTFCRTKEQMAATQQRQFEAQQLRLKEMKAFCEKYKNSEKESKQVASRLKVIEKMEREGLAEAVVEEKGWTFKFPTPEKLKNDASVLRISHMYYDWNPDTPKEECLLQDVDLFVDLDSRIGIFGANGAGKSTLLKLCLSCSDKYEGKKIEPIDGKIELNDGARIALFTQHHMEQLDMKLTPLEYMQERFPLAREQEMRNHLGGAGVKGDLALQKMAKLSGGQKSRVAFAVLTYINPHLLIMDEPTNHLDMETIDALLSALDTFQGGVLIVSHDQYFLDRAVNEYWGVNSGEVRHFFEGGVEEPFEQAKEFSYHYFVEAIKGAKEIREEKAEAERERKLQARKAEAQEAAQERAAGALMTKAAKKLNKAK